MAAEGATLTRLAGDAFASGRGDDARRLAAEAVTLLEQVGPSSELAAAYAVSASMCMLGATGGAMDWGAKAVATAELFGNQAAKARALNDIGSIRIVSLEDPVGITDLEESARIARAIGDDVGVGRALTQPRLWLRRGQVVSGRREVPRRVGCLHIRAGPRLVHALCRRLAGEGKSRAGTLGGGGEAGAQRRTCRSWQCPRRSSPTGHWAGSPPTGREHRYGASGSRMAARRGDRRPAADLAGRRHQGGARLAPGARPEQGRVAERIRPGREVRFALGDRRGRVLAVAGRRASSLDGDTPYAIHAAGDWRGAAEAWRALGCPYEEADALSDGDEDSMRLALDTFTDLGAAPAADLVRRRLRASGARSVPSRPRASTSAGPGGLTKRQIEILGLVEEGATNTEIARRLFIARRPSVTTSRPSWQSSG